MSNVKSPKIRFKGFTDDWEQRKLKDIANKVTTKNSGTLYVETLTNSAEFGIISQKDFFDHNISNLENIDGYYIVENNDFVYNPRISTSAPVGPINRNKLGRSGVMSPLYTVFRTHDVDEEYVEWFFKSSKWHKFMFFNGDTGARSDRFAIKDSVFFEMPIPIPHIDEQRKIGHFFSNLDSLITLHQRKYEKLKNIKQAMLEKMFPKNGENFPEIRFKGFTDAWEQREVKDLCSISTGKSNTQDKVEDGEYPFYVRSPIVERSTKYLYDEEAVITVGDGVGTGKVFHYVNGKYDLHQRCYRMFGFNEELNAKYFYHVFSKMFYKRVMSMTAKTSVDSVRMDMIANMEIPVPNVKEQEKIGAFLTGIDNLITLHQRKYEKVIKIKKSFLQKIFI